MNRLHLDFSQHMCDKKRRYCPDFARKFSKIYYYYYSEKIFLRHESAPSRFFTKKKQHL
jgi:hypothetical protein